MMAKTARAGLRQTDLTRALKAAAGAGLEVDSIKYDRDGNIVIITRGSSSGSGPNPCDVLLDR